MRTALVALALWACTGPADDDDTAPDDTGDSADTSDTSDTGVEGSARFGVRGGATVDPTMGTWVGTTAVYDVLVDATGAATDVLCELHFTSTGAPVTTPCASCTFSFAVEHLEATGQSGPDCDELWPPSHPGRLPSTWDATLGYDPTGAAGGPALMTWIDAYTDDGGTFHPAAWEATPRPDQPYGGATWVESTGAFTFDRPLRTYIP